MAGGPVLPACCSTCSVNTRAVVAAHISEIAVGYPRVQQAIREESGRTVLVQHGVSCSVLFLVHERVTHSQVSWILETTKLEFVICKFLDQILYFHWDVFSDSRNSCVCP